MSHTSITERWKYINICVCLHVEYIIYLKNILKSNTFYWIFSELGNIQTNIRNINISITLNQTISFIGDEIRKKNHIFIREVCIDWFCIRNENHRRPLHSTKCVRTVQKTPPKYLENVIMNMDTMNVYTLKYYKDLTWPHQWNIRIQDYIFTWPLVFIPNLQRT